MNDARPLLRESWAGLQGQSLEARVQELADREEIRELIGLYALRIAHGMSVAELFTEDGVFIVRFPGRPPHEVRGGPALRAYYEPPHRAYETLPMIHNFVLRIAGDEAVALCSNELRRVEDGKSMIGSGYYRDQLRREGGRWRFVERDATFFHYVPIEPGWAEATGGP
jgi:hypothetical protein